jgi:hypothetical protein
LDAPIFAAVLEEQFRKDIESIGFKVNPYDPCIANRILNRTQHTVTWHVDDLKSSHADPKANDHFSEWLLTSKYAYDEIGEVKASRTWTLARLSSNGFGLFLSSSAAGRMRNYIKSTIDKFQAKLEGIGTFHGRQSCSLLTKIQGSLTTREQVFFKFLL